jgi:hypothetical protein
LKDAQAVLERLVPAELRLHVSELVCRVALDGGTLRHGAAGGSFEVAAQLPWHG